MNEVDWLASTSPIPMLEFLRGKVSERKLRLFACACCRRFWHLIADERSRAAVETAEICFDQQSNYASLSTVREQAHRAAGECNVRLAKVVEREELQLRRVEAAAASAAAEVLQQAGVWGGATPAEIAARVSSHFSALTVKYSARIAGIAGRPSAKKERALQCVLLFDIVGNPFRPSTLDPSWLAWNESIVTRLAEAIYDDRTFDRLPELADALEQAGCTNNDILNHCRHPGPHVRGCWVLDLLLKKE